jgi:nucleoside-diphosphate-sugar epimerase
MNSLILGDTSQLAYYFPKKFERISSRNIQLDNFKDKFYDRIFFCFGEQRTYIENNDDSLLKVFTDINVDYTIKLIDFFKNICNKLIIYSSSELWNNCEGVIDLQTPFNYNYSPYIKSKELLTLNITNHAYPNVLILYPFNFNSIYRKTGFLFNKIFDSIIYERKIEIGDTYFYRDLIHPKYVVERSLICKDDEIVGSGRLTHVNDFIRNLYKYFNLSYEDLVIENFNKYLSVKRKTFYLNSYEIKYNDLFTDTIKDIKNKKREI